MKCSSCGSDSLVILTADKITCGECGATLEIVYWICTECNSVSRVQNGEYMDDFFIDSNTIEATCDELTTHVSNKVEDSNSCMEDLLYSCIRCGSSLVHKEGEDEYICEECGFSWEILNHG